MFFKKKKHPIIKDRLFEMNRLIFAVFEALKSEVTPEIRALKITIIQEKKVRLLKISFFYEGQPFNNSLDNYSSICAEATSSSAGMYLFDEEDYEYIQLDYPEPIPQEGSLVYYRKEAKDLASFKKVQDLFTSLYADKGEIYYSAHLRRVMQIALLGHVTPNIRMVGFEWFGRIIVTHFYLDGPIKESDRENIHEIMSYFIQHFKKNIVYLRIYRMDDPIILPAHHTTAYRRKEKSIQGEVFYKPKDLLP